MKSILPKPIQDNFAGRIVHKFAGKYLEKRYLTRFFRDADYGIENGRSILLYSVVSSAYNIYTEILLYHLLRKKGYSVDFIVCDGRLPACHILTRKVLQTQTKEEFCRKCFNRGRQILQSARIPFKVIRENDFVISTNRLPDNFLDIISFHFDQIDFGNIVKGALHRYYKSGTLPDDSEGQEIARKLLEASLINYFFSKKLIEQNKYCAVFFSHGIYSSWQALENYCRLKGIKYICYDRAKRLSSANFNINKPSPVWDFSEAWRRLEKFHLNPEQEEKVDDYLAQRELQKCDVYQYNFSEKEKDLQALKANLCIKADAKVITLFTNLIWDAANVARDIAFSDSLTWIIKTIEYFKDRSKVHVLLRTHPAEKVLGTQETYAHLIRSKISSLPENCTIIEAKEAINSFSIIDISDIGVCHTSTVGLEFAISGKPVILVSETHYRGKGFTHDVENSETYFQCLEKLLQDKNTISNQVTLARKYFYLMMFEYQKQMPLAFRKNGLFNGYTYNSLNQISQSEDIIKIIDVFDTNITDFIFL